MDNRVLMIAYHFPPLRGSSGIQRTLRFVQYLPERGWQPCVLAPHPRVYDALGGDLVREIPSGVVIEQAFALDAAKHLAIRGKYLGGMAVPDRYVYWVLGAVPAGLRLIRRYRPKVLWSTYPIATAHLIGYLLHKLSGLPWVADFRDPMLYDAWPEDKLSRKAHRWVESLTMRHCAKAVLVTEKVASFYRERYPGLPASRFATIPNGFDERSFEGLVRRTGQRGAPLTLVHSGLLELPDRDPRPLLVAISNLKTRRRVSANSLRVVLRGAGRTEVYARAIEELGLSEVVKLEPLLGYRAALQEIMDADGLLLYQGPTADMQIPAKLYEYIRVGRPIFAMVSPGGETDRLLAQLGIATRAPVDDVGAIEARFLEFLQGVEAGSAPVMSESAAMRYERRHITGELAAVLSDVAAASPGR